MSRFKGTYRIESTRLPGWDYSSPGYYYVTICTKNHAPYFGEIVNGVVHLSSIGEIAAEEWLNTAQVRSNISLDEWIIMPNHVHGILIILETTVETPRRGVSIIQNSNWKPASLGSTINQYKSICTKRIRAAIDPDFSWQSRFYDHIIRDEKSLNQIRTYIRNNPSQWALDHENPLNHPHP